MECDEISLGKGVERILSFAWIGGRVGFGEGLVFSGFEGF